MSDRFASQNPRDSPKSAEENPPAGSSETTPHDGRLELVAGIWMAIIAFHVGLLVYRDLMESVTLMLLVGVIVPLMLFSDEIKRRLKEAVANVR